MNRMPAVCALIALVFAASYAQGAHAQVHPATNLQQNEARSQQILLQGMQQSSLQGPISPAGNLRNLRVKLAEVWQALGLSPNDAHLVAAAYQPESKRVVPVSVSGKSDKEVAAMIQSAIESKDYMLANQTLIDYQKLLVQKGTHASRSE